MIGHPVSGRNGGMAAIGLLSLTVLLWGGAFRATAVGAEHTSSLMLSALRAGPAALVLLFAVPLLRARLPTKEQWLWAGVTGLVMVTFVTEALPEAITRAGAGNTAVLVNLSPLFVALAGVLLLGERVSRAVAAGLVVGFGGVVVMTAPQLGGSSGSGDLALGMGLATVASIGWAAGILVIKAVAERDPQLDMLGFTAAQYAVGAPILVIAAFAAKGVEGTDWTAGSLWVSVAWLALGTSALGSLAFFSALKRVSADRAAAWQFVVPVVAVLVEIARGNSPEAIVLAGMILAVAGVAIVNIPPRLESQDASRTGRPLPWRPLTKGSEAGR
jgi:drug/metabolite transporter (DMT)-like permease